MGPEELLGVPGKKERVDCSGHLPNKQDAHEKASRVFPKRGMIAWICIGPRSADLPKISRKWHQLGRWQHPGRRGLVESPQSTTPLDLPAAHESGDTCADCSPEGSEVSCGSA